MALTINRRIERSLMRVEKHLTSYLTADFPYAKKVIKFSLKGKGKGLRARVALLSSMNKTNFSMQIEKLAAAIELFHQATLIHDDVLDHAKVRRKQATINQKFGNQTAVMLGDYLFTKVMNWMVKEMPMAVQQIMAQAITQVCVGEIEEIGARFNYGLSINEYKRIIQYKTASLFSAACESGAVLGAQSKAYQAALKHYGLKIGMAFQIQDDLLDITGKDKTMGKQPGIDLQEGQITLPIIIALSALKPAEQKEFKSILGKGKIKNRRFQELLSQSKAIDKAKQLANQQIKSAEQALNIVPESPLKQELLNLANFSIDRKH